MHGANLVAEGKNTARISTVLLTLDLTNWVVSAALYICAVSDWLLVGRILPGVGVDPIEPVKRTSSLVFSSFSINSQPINLIVNPPDVQSLSWPFQSS